MRTNKRIAASLVALSGVMAQGCTTQGAEGEEPPRVVDGSSQAIIGGVPANSPQLNAIGTLGYLERYDWGDGYIEEYWYPFCTGSLIAQQTVLTAKHCVAGLDEDASEYYVPAFGIGPDGFHPVRIVPIVDVQRAPNDEGGIVGMGHDVATVHLSEAVTNYPLLSFAKLTDEAIGKRYGAIGYGVKDKGGNRGPRLIGNVTVNALEGKWFELMFGNFEGFLKWADSMGGYPYGSADHQPVEDGGVDDGWGDDGGVDDGWDAGSDDDWYEEWLREIYEGTTLIPGYEADTGRKRGDAQICRGDSGGPLVKSSGGKLVAYGVASAAVHSTRMPCDYGSIYATFGDEVMTFLNDAKEWKDPCDGLTLQGSCDGDTVMRCTRMGEGPRREIITDCSLLGQTCGVASSGEAVCHTPGEEPAPLYDSGDMPTRDEVNAFNASVQSRVDAAAKPKQ